MQQEKQTRCLLEISPKRSIHHLVHYSGNGFALSDYLNDDSLLSDRFPFNQPALVIYSSAALILSLISLYTHLMSSFHTITL